MSARRNRLDRVICKQLGISQDAVRTLLAQKRIKVDGEVVLDRELLITGFNSVMLDDKPVFGEEPVYLMLHKPAGILSANHDPVHPVATSLIDHPCIDKLHIVGRLDLHSTGLLLLSNDSRWSRMLNDPDKKIGKQYLVTVKHPIPPEAVEAFQSGMHFPFENITTRPAQLEILEDTMARITLFEGRYHQIKRMFGRYRNPVLSIHRTAIGSLQLTDSLPSGQWRELSSTESWAIDGISGTF